MVDPKWQQPLRLLARLAALCGLLAGGAIAVSAVPFPASGEARIQAPPEPPPAFSVSARSSPLMISPLVEGQVEWTYHKSLDSAHPSGEEQVYVWLMNRARQDPSAEGLFLADTGDAGVESAIAFYGVDKTRLKMEFAGYTAAPPAAFDRRLYAAAKAHSDDLIARDAQDHDGQFLLATASFSCLRLRGNVFSYSRSGLYGHTAFNIDWGYGEGGMQDGRGHRQAIMALDGNYTNVGIAAVPDDNPETSVGPWVITGNFAEADTGAADHYNRFLVGTVWQDVNGNGRFDADEGLANVRVQPDNGSYYAVTAAGGGYAIPIVNPGDYLVNFSGGDLAVPRTYSVSIGAYSLLLDLRDAVSQAITFGVAPTIVIGGTGTVSANGGASGNPVTFTSQTTSVCTTSGPNGSTVTGVAAGTCIIAANQSGNADYNPAPQETQRFPVGFCWQCLPSHGGWRAILR